MDELANVASNAANDAPLPNDQVTGSPSLEVDEKPSASSRDALSRALAKGGFGDEAEQSASGRARDGSGRFAAKAADTTNMEAEAEPAPQEPLAAPPPSRFAREAQAEWANVPQTVRAEVARLENELTQGLEKYKSQAEAFEPIRQFDDMAKASGTTLQNALSAYVSMEKAWGTDPVQGFAMICKNMGADPVELAIDIVGKLSDGQAPQAQQASGDNREVAALKSEIASLKSKLGDVDQFVSEQRQAPIKNQVAEFQKNAPFFELLAPSIADILRAGKAAGLQEAYDAALAQQPDLAAVVASSKAAKAAPKPQPEAQTRKAALSITGSPSPGSNPSSMKPAGSTREALQNAFSQVGL